MDEDIEQQANKSSSEFKQGFEAALNFLEDPKNREAENELGQELEDQDLRTEPVNQGLLTESATPLFMRDNPDANKGNAQDVKDETEE